MSISSLKSEKASKPLYPQLPATRPNGNNICFEYAVASAAALATFELPSISSNHPIVGNVLCSERPPAVVISAQYNRLVQLCLSQIISIPSALPRAAAQYQHYIGEARPILFLVTLGEHVQAQPIHYTRLGKAQPSRCGTWYLSRPQGKHTVHECRMLRSNNIVNGR